jgi:glycosyltransferase involved in cell wall biosynthesis
MLRHVTDDPVRAVTLAWRALPAPLRGLLRFAGPYGKASAAWGAGDRRSALTALEGSPAKLAAFSLAVDQPTVARSALVRLSVNNTARPRLAARLAYREGRLSDAVSELDGAPGWRAGRLRKSIGAEVEMLEPGRLTLPAEQAKSARNKTKGRVLHLVTDALPSTNAGYTVRTQQVALAQRAVGLDPHVATRIGFPVTAGAVDGRARVAVDGVPYHRLLPWVMPGRMDTLYETHLRHAARLTSDLQPSVLHAASNYANALIALALRDATKLPVVYEVRGFWEDTWLSRHATTKNLTSSDRYTRTRALEAHCMLAADLVVTLGEAMREEILARGVDEDKVIIVPNGVSEEFLRPLPDGAALRQALGIKDGEHVVGLVSSLVAHEGIGTLLEAVKILNDRDIPTRALIVGDGQERTALERQAAELGVNAIFTGRVPMRAVREYHAVLDVFVVPRTPDRVCQLVTPLKPVEAMASGLPVVVSAVRALEEIINDQVTGLTSPPLDAGALADRLQELLASPDRRAALGARAREWVSRDRTWAHNAVRYRAAYERLGAVLSPLPWGSPQQEEAGRSARSDHRARLRGPAAGPGGRPVRPARHRPRR